MSLSKLKVLVYGHLNDADVLDRTTGDVSYVPITSTQPAGSYWGIDQDLTYGESVKLLSGSSGIVDTGTTLTMIATGMIYHL